MDSSMVVGGSNSMAKVNDKDGFAVFPYSVGVKSRSCRSELISVRWSLRAKFYI